MIDYNYVCVFFCFSFKIPDNYTSYSVDDFCVPAHYYDDIKGVIIPKGLIMDRYIVLTSLPYYV